MRLIGRSGWLGRAPVLALAALALVVWGGTGVAAAAGQSNNGTLKVHEYGTPSGTESNDPKVCAFNLEGFQFDQGQQVAVTFSLQGGDGPEGTLPDPNWFGPYTADGDGSFATAYFNHGGVTLAAGHYKATAYGQDADGGWTERAKSKVFKVDCGTPKGTITVTKTLADGSQPAGGTTFPITVTCSAAEYSRTFDLAVGESATTTDLPGGAVCTVSEQQPAGWDAPTFVPAGTVTVPSGGNATVTVVNNRPAPPVTRKGTVTVQKILAEGSRPAGDTRFDITVTCSTAGYEHVFHLAPGQSGTTEQLPAGTQCTVAETPPSGWDQPTFVPATRVTVKACATTKVRVVNNLPPAPPTPVGTVTVTKALADGSQPAGDTTFPITVTCNAAEYRHTFHLAVGQSGTTGELPAGTVCSVTETRPAGWEPPTFSPDATVTVPSGGNATVTVVNNRPAPPAVAGLTLVKTNNPTGAVSPGDVIAYTLTARATGNVDQADVVIADTMPVGSTYVTGSGQCVPASRTPCDVAYVETSRLLTFSVGTMSPGDEVTVTFSVRVATSAPVPGSITNVGTVTSVLAEATSNPVSNPVVAVLGEKISKPSTGLAATGPPAPIVPLLVVALALTVLGGLMAGAARRDEHRL